jgi:hypothetical protein
MVLLRQAATGKGKQYHHHDLPGDDVIKLLGAFRDGSERLDDEEGKMLWCSRRDSGKGKESVRVELCTIARSVLEGRRV